MAGKFFVIEGTDGAGKETQAMMLTKKITLLGNNVLYTDFPQYGNPSAYFIEELLNGRYQDLTPEQATLIFAMDRFDIGNKQMNPHLKEGGYIISNRWTTANEAYQSGIAKTPEEKERILNFIQHTEYDILKLPRADEVIFIDIEPIVGQRLVDLKQGREYTTGKDIYEQDINRLNGARERYTHFANSQNNWSTINMMKGEFTEDEMRNLDISQLVKSKQKIHEEIFSQVAKYL